jgi:hypothetical protein
MELMKMHKRLEKLALNAFEARQMAKQVGVLPEGNWKWALRKLRALVVHL